MKTRFFKFLFTASIFFTISSAIGVLNAFALPALNDTRIEKLKISKLKLAGRTINAEMAVTYDERERGLMYRKSMGENDGMLFVFDGPQPMAFWMKNTLIPLSIGYFDENKKLINSVEMSPAVVGEARPKTYEAARPAMYALEMNKGWFPKNKVKPGAVLTVPAAKKR